MIIIRMKCHKVFKILKLCDMLWNMSRKKESLKTFMINTVFFGEMKKLNLEFLSRGEKIWSNNNQIRRECLLRSANLFPAEIFVCYCASWWILKTRCLLYAECDRDVTCQETLWVSDVIGRDSVIVEITHEI